MASSNLTVEVKVRWWVVALYAKLLVFFALLTGCEPDPDKVRNFISKYGLKVSEPK